MATNYGCRRNQIIRQNTGGTEHTMTPQDYLDKYGVLVKWMIHKRFHDIDDRQDAFQEVAMIICERIEKLNTMDETAVKRYLLHSTKYCWLKWYKHTKLNILQHRTLGQDDEKATLDWLFESNKYRPDRFYDSELKWRQHRENLEDQMEAWAEVKKQIKRIENIGKFFGRSTGVNILNNAYKMGRINGKRSKK